MKVGAKLLTAIVENIVAEASEEARSRAGRKGGLANVVSREYEPKSKDEWDTAMDEEDELDEKEYKGIKGMAHYKKGKGGFDLGKCIDDLSGVEKIRNPAAVCRSGEIAVTGKAKATRGRKAKD